MADRGLPIFFTIFACLFSLLVRMGHSTLLYHFAFGFTIRDIYFVCCLSICYEHLDTLHMTRWQSRFGEVRAQHAHAHARCVVHGGGPQYRGTRKRVTRVCQRRVRLGRVEDEDEDARKSRCRRPSKSSQKTAFLRNTMTVSSCNVYEAS